MPPNPLMSAPTVLGVSRLFFGGCGSHFVFWRQLSVGKNLKLYGMRLTLF